MTHGRSLLPAVAVALAGLAVCAPGRASARSSAGEVKPTFRYCLLSGFRVVREIP
jgi:hypothetical protein